MGDRKICDIKVGYSCNNNCIHCAISLNRKFLIDANRPINRTFEECKNKILEAKQDGAEEVVLTGGEVTIRQDFVDLLSLICNQGMKVNVQTNGRAFHAYDLAKEVASFKNIYYSIALHGHGEDLHDRITQKKGSFMETVTGIRYLVELNKFVSIKLVLSKLNYKFLLETCELIDDLNIKHINLTFPHGVGNAGTNFFDVVPKYSEANSFIIEALENLTRRGILFETEAIPYCFLEGFEQCASEHFLKEIDFEVSAIESDKVNWSEKRPDIKRKGKQCPDCLYDEICEGPWCEYIENYGEREFKPIDINAGNMMPMLVKYKKIKDFRTGKVKFDLEKELALRNNGKDKTLEKGN